MRPIGPPKQRLHGLRLRHGVSRSPEGDPRSRPEAKRQVPVGEGHDARDRGPARRRQGRDRGRRCRGRESGPARAARDRKSFRGWGRPEVRSVAGEQPERRPLGNRHDRRSLDDVDEERGGQSLDDGRPVDPRVRLEPPLDRGRVGEENVRVRPDAGSGNDSGAGQVGDAGDPNVARREQRRMRRERRCTRHAYDAEGEPSSPAEPRPHPRRAASGVPRRTVTLHCARSRQSDAPPFPARRRIARARSGRRGRSARRRARRGSRETSR